MKAISGVNGKAVQPRRLIIRGFRIARLNVGNGRFNRLHPHIWRNFNFNIFVSDFRHFTHQAACGYDFVILLHSSDFSLMRLSALLLRTDEEEIEDNEDEQKRKQLHKKCRTTSTARGSTAPLGLLGDTVTIAKKLSVGNRTAIRVTSQIRDRIGDQFNFGSSHKIEAEGKPVIEAWEVVH